jgi:hypothetical protein
MSIHYVEKNKGKYYLMHTCIHSRIESKNTLQSNQIANFLQLVLAKQTMIVPTRKTSRKRAADCVFF